MATIGRWSFLASQTITGNRNVEANMSRWTPEEGSTHEMSVTILFANYEDLTVFVKNHIGAACFRNLTFPPKKRSRHCGWASDEHRG